jgi:hypothetical protein
MKEEYRIDVSQKAVRNEQHVTQDGKNAECEYRRHAAAGEDRRRGAKAKAVDPMHRLSAPHSQHGLTGFFCGVRNCGWGAACQDQSAKDDNNGPIEHQGAPLPLPIGNLLVRKHRPQIVASSRTEVGGIRPSLSARSHLRSQLPYIVHHRTFPSAWVKTSPFTWNWSVEVATEGAGAPAATNGIVTPLLIRVKRSRKELTGPMQVTSKRGGWEIVVGMLKILPVETRDSGHELSWGRARSAFDLIISGHQRFTTQDGSSGGSPGGALAYNSACSSNWLDLNWNGEAIFCSTIWIFNDICRFEHTHPFPEVNWFPLYLCAEPNGSSLICWSDEMFCLGSIFDHNCRPRLPGQPSRQCDKNCSGDS